MLFVNFFTAGRLRHNLLSITLFILAMSSWAWKNVASCRILSLCKLLPCSLFLFETHIVTQTTFDTTINAIGVGS